LKKIILILLILVFFILLLNTKKHQALREVNAPKGEILRTTNRRSMIKTISNKKKIKEQHRKTVPNVPAL
jgi:predicted Holliday junction resolvase-like endonuclease